MIFPGPAGWMHLPPNGALVLLTAGIGLMYWELNRPGSVLPGAIGLFATLLATANLANRGISFAGTVLVLSAISLLAVELIRQTSILVAVAGTLALVLGFRSLLTPTCCPSITLPFAAGCGVLLGGGTSYLTRIARRARVNKGLD